MAGKGNKVVRMDYVRSETDLFSEPGYDLSINSTTTSDYHTVSSISQTAPLEFFIQGNDQQYLDLSKTKLKIRAKLVNSDGLDIPAPRAASAAAGTPAETYIYAPVNYLLASAFDRVTVHLNETEVTPKTSLYPYQAYLETLLSYGSDFKKGQAEAGGFYRVKDEASLTDEGWTKRQELCAQSAEFELSGRPHGDIFTQPRYMMPGVDVRITFHRSSDLFCLMSSGTPLKDVKLVILEAKLRVNKVSLLPSIHMAHIKTWEKNPCVYPSKRVVMKSYGLPVGTFQHTNESLLNGLIPDRVVLGLVGTVNASGSYDTNPFNFEDHGLSQIIITCNSEVSTQYKIDMDKRNNRTLDGFTSLFEAMGITNCDSGLDLRKSEYLAGKALYAFDLRNLSDGFALPRHGNVSIYLKFRRALTSSVTVIVYPEYPSVMYIPHDKQVTFKEYAKESN